MAISRGFHPIVQRIASILRPALRDYGGQVAHRATTESRVLFHGSSLPTGTLVQEGGTPRPWANEEIKEECSKESILKETYASENLPSPLFAKEG